MRGKPSKSISHGLSFGITPADAGKTICLSASRRWSGDHPRGCGENSLNSSSCRRRSGSPPRMRGKLNSYPFRYLRLGITPADAGKTLNDAGMDGRRQDHPRGCGENERIDAMLKPCPGSPPRMRGKHRYEACGEEFYGITPADAGKTLKRSFRNQPFCS